MPTESKPIDLGVMQAALISAKKMLVIAAKEHNNARRLLENAQNAYERTSAKIVECQKNIDTIRATLIAASRTVANGG